MRSGWWPQMAVWVLSLAFERREIIRTSSCFSRRDASNYVFADSEMLTVKFWPQVASGHVTLRSNGEWRSICYQSICLEKLNTMRSSALLDVFSVGRNKQKIHDLIWPEMTVEKDHWLPLYYHSCLEIWSSWRFRMINDKTVAMLTQNCRKIAILAWYSLQKEVKGRRSLR